MKRLILFGTSGCHLCEEAESLVQTCIPDGVDHIDIAEQPEWQSLYAVRIPVLLDPESKEELAWPFDSTGLAAFVERVGGMHS